MMARPTPTRVLRLLLVEDSDRDALLLRELLRDAAGSEMPEIVRVSKLADAVSRLATEQYDAVLLDLGLPDGHGVDSVDRIHAAQRDAAVVVMTGLDDERSAIEALRRGAQEYTVKGRYDGTELLRVLQHAIERHRVLSEVDNKREQEFLRASHDALTGLANRLLFGDRAREAVAQATRRGERLALCFVDLDGFKPVNDHFGHAAGDAVLQEVARALRETVRDSDTVARVGGDEFAVLLRPVRGVEEVLHVASRMVERVREIRQIQGHAVSVGASIGAALFPDHGTSFEQLMMRADQAMYVAKHGARGTVRLFDGVLAQGPASEAVDLLWQPWVDLQRGTFSGVEALIRAGGSSNASDVVRRAERGGALTKLSMKIVEQACAQWTHWQTMGIAPPRLALNASRGELAESEFAARWIEVLERYGVALAQVQIEVAETAFDGAEDLPVLDNLRRLRTRGVRVILDNFGREQASLLKLARLPIDGIKLDKSLVQGLRIANSVARAVVGGLLDLAAPWGLEVIAAGVEEAEDLARCRSLSCRYAQGFLLGSPQTAEQATRLLSQPPVLPQEPVPATVGG